MHLRTPDKHSLLVIVILFIKMSIKKIYIKQTIYEKFYSKNLLFYHCFDY